MKRGKKINKIWKNNKNVKNLPNMLKYGKLTKKFQYKKS